jgi:hypothetical protein
MFCFLQIASVENLLKVGVTFIFSDVEKNKIIFLDEMNCGL